MDRDLPPIVIKRVRQSSLDKGVSASTRAASDRAVLDAMVREIEQHCEAIQDTARAA
jgi:hypothetical protein